MDIDSNNPNVQALKGVWQGVKRVGSSVANIPVVQTVSNTVSKHPMLSLAGAAVGGHLAIKKADQWRSNRGY